MKKLILPLLIFIYSLANAQDMIIKKNRDTINCKIETVSSDAIIYTLPPGQATNIIMKSDVNSFEQNNTLTTVFSGEVATYESEMDKVYSNGISGGILIMLGGAGIAVSSIVINYDTTDLDKLKSAGNTSKVITIASGTCLVIGGIMECAAFIHFKKAEKLRSPKLSLNISSNGVGLAYHF